MRQLFLRVTESLLASFFCLYTLLASSSSVEAAPLQPPVVDRYVDQGDFSGLQTRLAEWLMEAFSNSQKAAVQDRMSDLLADPVYVRVLAQHEMIRLTGAGSLSRVSSETGGVAFLKTFLTDSPWVEMMLASGPAPVNTPDGLNTLREIWLADQTSTAKKGHALAAAVALSYSSEPTRERMRMLQNSIYRPATAVDRYWYYKKAWEAGKLQPMFDALKTWELRFVVSGRQSQDNESLAWLLENVNLPLWKYPDACWMCEYRGCNAFGDSVQGPDFYTPWNPVMSWAESAFRHGGVCGSLSTFGATAAQAHGIPAYTCGQPGHCAYAVRFARKKWVGGFGGPAGWPHNYLWRGTYYSILMMEDAFFDDTSILRSERSLWLAHLYQSRDRATTYAAYDLAVRWCRPNYHAWDELISARLSDPATTPVEWKKLAEMLLVALQPHTQPMTELLDKFEDQHLLKNMTEPEKISWFTTVHRIIAGTKGEIAWDWNMEDYFQKQAGKLKAQSAQWALYRNAISLHAAQDHFLGQLLAWGSKTAEKSGDPRQYIVAATAALRESGTSMKEATLKKTYSSLILAAEKARAMDAFQCVSDAACKGATAGDLLQVKLPADRVLVSGDGLFYASSTSGWDDPSRHRDVLRECGGQFHTSEEQAPYAVVQLKKPVMLTGVVLVNTEGNQDRAVPLKLYVSTDGATWLPVWESSRAQEQWIVPLSGKHIQARWIKVESQHGAGRNYFHLRNICVYGES